MVEEPEFTVTCVPLWPPRHKPPPTNLRRVIQFLNGDSAGKLTCRICDGDHRQGLRNVSTHTHLFPNAIRQTDRLTGVTMNRTRTLGIAFLSMAAALAVSANGVHAESSGIVLAVVQQSEADGDTGRRTLQVEAPVFAGDRIITGPVGEAQVRFRDETKLVVGPNSTLVIDAFVFADEDTARQISIEAVRGAFRFIAGSSPKDAYKITTPTATIGIRG